MAPSAVEAAAHVAETRTDGSSEEPPIVGSAGLVHSLLVRRPPWMDGAAGAGLGVGPRADLALFGAPAAFAEPVVVGRPNPVDRGRVLERIAGVLDRNWQTNHGPLVTELEDRLSALLGVQHCITVASGTSGLQLVAQALGLRGEVIVPSFTFVATAHALMATGLRPVFCDIDPVTHCLDPAAVQAAIGPATTGILGVHLWGNAAPVAELEDIAERHGLALYFDAAHALGSWAGRRPIGAAGSAEVFSLHATKMVSAFEGGLVTTDDDDLARRLRMMSNFGFSDEDQVACFGVNAKMSEAAAAMALTSLEEIDAAMAHNQSNIDTYRDELAGVAGVEVDYVDTPTPHNRQYVVAEIDEAASGIRRDDLVAVLRLENIMARRYFHPGCHRHEPYRSLNDPVDLRLAVTEQVADRVLVLPTGRSVEPEDVRTICSRIRAAVHHAPRVPAALVGVEDPRLPHFWRPGPVLHG